MFIVVFYYAFIHLTHRSTSCVYKNIFGIPCPGCGMTRSYKALLKLDFQQAFYYHPLFFLVPILFLFILVQFCLLKKKGKANRWIEWILYIMVGLFLVVYVYRMILFFPHTAPMDFYHEGLIPKVISESLR
ncbi:MAG: DUF2752 domain-containing protein [Vallitaleaceae bacterium]|nr:DUF2752 domain-containing protein [Vallitaleaceae bacterium]